MEADGREPRVLRLKRLMRSGLLRFATAASLAAGGLTVAGSLAAVGWVFEMACHFRVQYLAALLACSVVFAVAKSWRWSAAAFVLAAWNVVLIAPLYWPQRIETRSARLGPPWRIVSVNLFSGNPTPERVIEFLQSEQPDVVVALELTPRWQQRMEALADDLPHQQVFPREGNFGIGIYSAWPIESVDFEPVGGGNLIAVAGILRDSERLTVIGAHPFPPMGATGVARRNGQLQRTAEIVAGVEGPCILAGDLNATSWSPAFQDLLEQSSLSDSRSGFGVQPTWPAGRMLLRIPIDHCLTSHDLRTLNRRIGPDVGSDHLPVVVDVSGPSAE